MTLPIDDRPPHPSRGQCLDSMLLPPQAEGRRLQCQLDAGHTGHHSATEGRLGVAGVRRVWPRESPDPQFRNARSASGANVRPLKGKS